MIRRIATAIIGVLFMFPSFTFAAGFDCTKATSTVEKLICSDDKLSKADEQLSAVYSKALHMPQAQRRLRRKNKLDSHRARPVPNQGVPGSGVQEKDRCAVRSFACRRILHEGAFPIFPDSGRRRRATLLLCMRQGARTAVSTSYRLRSLFSGLTAIALCCKRSHQSFR